MDTQTGTITVFSSYWVTMQLVGGELSCQQVVTGAQPKAGTGLKMQTVRFFNVTLLGIYR